MRLCLWWTRLEIHPLLNVVRKMMDLYHTKSNISLKPLTTASIEWFTTERSAYDEWRLFVDFVLYCCSIPECKDIRYGLNVNRSRIRCMMSFADVLQQKGSRPRGEEETKEAMQNWRKMMMMEAKEKPRI